MFYSLLSSDQYVITLYGWNDIVILLPGMWNSAVDFRSFQAVSLAILFAITPFPLCRTRDFSNAVEAIVTNVCHLIM